MQLGNVAWIKVIKGTLKGTLGSLAHHPWMPMVLHGSIGGLGHVVQQVLQGLDVGINFILEAHHHGINEVLVHMCFQD